MPQEARHGFLIDIPPGTANDSQVLISEHRDVDLSELSEFKNKLRDTREKEMRVAIDRNRWLLLAPSFWEEANRRLRANSLPTLKFQKNASQPIPVHPSLGKELCVLCWSAEEAPPDSIPNALKNWESLAPEERWWLYTMTVASTGQALKHCGIGWRKALRAALAESPFNKSEKPLNKSNELLGHDQLSFKLD